MKIGIIGHGFVGKATKQLECADIEIIIYDVIDTLCYPLGTTISDMKSCNIIFVCVPTPEGQNGECVTTYVETVMENIKKSSIDTTKTHVVIRSTVPIGFSDSVGAYFLPEFLTEKNYIQDFINCKNWIIGSNNNTEFEQSITELFNLAYKAKCINYNTITFVSTKEGETIKYTRNCFLATKIAFFNEIQEICENIGVNYEIVRTGAISDDRIGASHTMVPGFDGSKGFGGHCLPKDICALNYYVSNFQHCNHVLSAVIRRNEHDRVRD
jgi:UDPglucose 6-dehydrogenase